MMDHTFTLPRILDRAEALFGASLAVKGDNLGMTYGQLADRVARLAAALRNMGLSKGDRVALLARNSFRYLEINLACARRAHSRAPELPLVRTRNRPDPS